MIKTRFLHCVFLLLSLFNVVYSLPTSVKKGYLEKSINKDGLMDHLKVLQGFADDNGGNRLVGTKGHQDTLDYIVKSVTAFGYHPQLQEIKLIRNDSIEHSLTTTIDNEQRTFESKLIPGSPSTSNEGISATLVPVDNPCGPIQKQQQQQPWIAMMQRGQCSLSVKAAYAQQGGAAAVLIYKSKDFVSSDDDINSFKATIPTGAVSTNTSSILLAALKQSSLKVQLKMVTKLVPVTSHNIIVETKAGNKSNVVMIGAHTDSVMEGPGINDDGSGTAALLEIARHLDQTKVTNTVRFGWWTAEEEGLIGSTAYLDSLADTQKRAISLYLNADMIASPNYVNMVYEGNESNPPPGFSAAPRGSKSIQLAFETYFDENDEPHQLLGYDVVAADSDAGPFYKASIPSGGLSTGFAYIKTKEEQTEYGGQAGIAHDPCYHGACDTIKNANPKGFILHARGYAHVLERYSQSTVGLLDI